MQPLAIVEPFNERKDLSARVVPRSISLVMHQLILEQKEKVAGTISRPFIRWQSRSDGQETSPPQPEHFPLLSRHKYSCF